MYHSFYSFLIVTYVFPISKLQYPAINPFHSFSPIFPNHKCLESSLEIWSKMVVLPPSSLQYQFTGIKLGRKNYISRASSRFATYLMFNICLTFFIQSLLHSYLKKIRNVLVLRATSGKTSHSLTPAMGLRGCWKPQEQNVRFQYSLESLTKFLCDWHK